MKLPVLGVHCDYNASVKHRSMHLTYNALLSCTAIKAALAKACCMFTLNGLHSVRSATPANFMPAVRNSNISPYILAKMLLFKV